VSEGAQPHRQRRSRRDPSSPVVLVKDHYRVCADTGSAGNAIDFLVRIKGTSFNDAMHLLTS